LLTREIFLSLYPCAFASLVCAQGLLGQEVVLTLADGSPRTGTVYTVDPINFSVALLKVRPPAIPLPQ